VEYELGKGEDEVDVEGYAGECHGDWSRQDTSRLYGGYYEV
jgi:hypothetical protein